MNVRLMNENDYDDIYQIWINTPGMGLNNLDDSREGIAKFLRRNPTTCFVAEDNGKLIGVIISGNDGRRGYIYHAAVVAVEREKGVGTALLNASLEALKHEGINKVALVVFSKNETGNKFWESQEFIKRDDLIYRNKSLTDIQRIDT
ncbi:MAG: GNAT family N-acetyltransferase [Sedimentibacter sp.]|uniref:GNAT family N-acetyltransferase n=1 Tax=Sedimentibacter sp. TaxID=1960295 RepID=UPI003159531D